MLLRHADLQAALSNSGWRRDRVLVDATSLLGASEPLLIECNDGVRLTAQHTPALKQSGRVAILLHGWEGSAGSLHVVSAGNRLWHEGFR
ncbi:MAG: alpha/beta hydrolase, partial [Gammaproteobacteria bacterium]|nr:alpha/beta hydrolase [Gammaproteobacteria bacterium]